MLIGRALCSAGVLFHVWHIGSSSYPENTSKRGEQDGITWEYLSPSTNRPKNRLLRILYFIYGCLLLPFRLAPFRRKICVYLYYQGDVINLWALLVCRLLSIPVAQECCEWWPNTPEETRYSRWMYHKIMFRWSTGALPISSLIESRVREIARKDYPVLKVPVLVDADEVRQQCGKIPESPGTKQQYLFWCGLVDGYKRDPLFLIQTLGYVGKRHAIWPHLVFGGPCSDVAREELLKTAKDVGLKADQVVITGFIPETELFRLATHASVLLLPLWDDDRSKSRFPTKMGLYAAAGRPILSSPIGEITYFLQDGKTALFAPPGDGVDWSDCISRLMQDESLRDRIAKQVLAEILPRVEYRSVGPSLREFFCMLRS